MDKTKAKQLFTTGEIAKICQVAPRTVSKWIDSGLLKGYRIPGSQDRRVTRVAFVEFLKEQKMPLGEFADDGLLKTLVVSQDRVLVANVERELTSRKKFKVAVVADAFDAGVMAALLRPDCVVVDFSFDVGDASRICKGLRRDPDFGETVLLGVLPNADRRVDFDRSIVNETFRKPFDAALLAERIESLCAACRY